MYAFSYCIELCDGCGYRPTMSDAEETNVEIQVCAKNRATADRMVRSILNHDAVVDLFGACIGKIEEN